jgi:DNA-binding NarL/FixJ family response regulator
MPIRIVVVDDHRIVREGLALMLDTAEGIEMVGEASSGEELFALLERVEPDVILLDVRMPGMTGLQVLERLQVDHAEIRVLMLSMHDDAGYVQQAIRLGAMGYLLKSVGLDELVRAVIHVTSGQAYLQGELAGALVDRPGESEVHLSPRETEILTMLADGYENKQVARRLGISEATVKTHLRSLYQKLDAAGRAEAVATAMRLGIFE